MCDFLFKLCVFWRHLWVLYRFLANEIGVSNFQPCVPGMGPHEDDIIWGYSQGEESVERRGWVNWRGFGICHDMPSAVGWVFIHKTLVNGGQTTGGVDIHELWE